MAGYSYLPIFGLFSLLTVYFFLRAIYEQADLFPGFIFLFLMNGYYFSSFNTVRYYLALAIALYSTKYVLRGEYLKFILWILTAALFHKSVLVVIPIYLGAKWLAGILLRSISRPLWRRLLTAGTALVFAAYFVLFLRSAYDVDIRLLPYLNWIFY